MDVRDRIRAYRSARKLSKAGLATAAGLHPNTLRSMDEAGWSPQFSTLQALLDLMAREPAEEAAA